MEMVQLWFCVYVLQNCWRGDLGVGGVWWRAGRHADVAVFGPVEPQIVGLASDMIVARRDFLVSLLSRRHRQRQVVKGQLVLFLRYAR